jgi:amino acid adenylation domain-containing protein
MVPSAQAGGMSGVTVAAASVGRFLPTAREQEGLWLLEQSANIGAANNLPFAVALEGELDRPRLCRAWALLVEREPALRRELAVSNGRLVHRQRSEPLEPPELELVDAVDERESANAASERCARALDPLRWPPFRAALISGPDERHVLLIVLHHCVIDGASLEPLFARLMDIYQRLAAGGQADQAPAADLLPRYVADEREAVASASPAAAAYWRPLLGELEDVARLPTAGGLHNGPEGRAISIEFEVPSALRLALQKLARDSETSVFLALLAGLQALQHRYASGDDDGVATAVAMDARPRYARGAPGMFANEAPLVSRPTGDMAFREFLAHVAERSRTMFEFRRYPFTEALARVGTATGGRGGLSEAGITYLRLGRIDLSTDGVAARVLGILPTGHGRRRLLLWIFDQPELLRGRFDLDAGLLGPDGARRIAKHYIRLLESVTADPAVRLGDAELLDGEERRRLLVDMNNTTAPAAAASSISSLVEAQVRRSPERVAIADMDRALSYAELDTRANRLAHHLLQLGIRPAAPVGVCLDRSSELVVTLLAILKAGVAYLPLDPEYPRRRLLLMLEEAHASVVVTDGRHSERLESGRARLVSLDGDAEVVAKRPATPPDVAIGADDTAYVIFTSGSTGVPKGVAMPHGALVNLLSWQIRQFLQPPDVRVLQFASPSFDVAFQEIFSTLASGGTLLPVDEDTRRDLARLAEFVGRMRPRRLFLPFPALNGLARHLTGSIAVPEEVEVITAGERLEVTPAIRELCTRRPHWTLTNQYGPTESHVVTAHRLVGSASTWPTLPPIGRPIANARVYVLDRRMQPMPLGVAGELFLGGRCLADGYVNRPKLTSERFGADPYGERGARLYRTGDLVRWREDGELEFIGRVDNQVKIRGFRVEPGEIEARLVEHPGVREAVVVPRDDGPGGLQLVGYIVSGGHMPSTADLRDHLARHLPEHMRPVAIIELPQMPRTVNGKLDRRALPAPDWDASVSEGYASPGTETERALAQVWAEVLNLDRVGADDNFFRLGGHSLLAGEVAARAREALGCDVPVRLVFACPTVRSMASAIESAAETARDKPIPRARRLPWSSV